ncbi:hypothetical protein E2C01_050436 [Portunus trituberculatus]|uniref:Uncharacterized protein n=1 Tax=Portunus trituberculatus TaxID=210409 RepID=A0A5B7GFY5_PORTR|nr:hypothetical protein [Portunus trituberculatus]
MRPGTEGVKHNLSDTKPRLENIPTPGNIDVTQEEERRVTLGLRVVPSAYSGLPRHAPPHNRKLSGDRIVLCVPVCEERLPPRIHIVLDLLNTGMTLFHPLTNT